MDFSSITGSTSFLLQGAAYTFELTATSAIGAIILGTFLALGKMAKSRVLSLLCSGYINLMRAVPLVLILFWFFFLVPVFIAWFTGSPIPVPVGPEKTALITFILLRRLTTRKSSAPASSRFPAVSSTRAPLSAAPSARRCAT